MIFIIDFNEMKRKEEKKRKKRKQTHTRILVFNVPQSFITLVVSTDYQSSFPFFTIHRHMFYCSSVNNRPNIRQRSWRSSTSTSWRLDVTDHSPANLLYVMFINKSTSPIYTIVRNYDITPIRPTHVVYYRPSSLYSLSHIGPKTQNLRGLKQSIMCLTTK